MTWNKEDKGNPLSLIEKEEGLSKKTSKGEHLSLIKNSRIQNKEDKGNSSSLNTRTRY